MGIVQSICGTFLSPVLAPYSYWVVKLRDRPDSRAFLSEIDGLDWSNDLVGTGDINDICELWLLCPPHTNAHAHNPLGTTCRLPIVHSGTAFQFKVGNVIGLVENERQTMSQVIGRVNDKTDGSCVCFIYDADIPGMSEPWYTTIYHFGSWRPGIAPIGAVSHHVLGLDMR